MRSKLFISLQLYWSMTALYERVVEGKDNDIKTRD